MGNYVKQVMSRILDHYLVINLLLALVILTFVGVGEVGIVCLLGILLCGMGILQLSAQVDLWIFAPFILYNLVSMASSYAVYGNITDGYASTQMLYPVIYLLMACLEDEERRMLKRFCVLWTGIAALGGILQFVGRVFLEQRAWRAGGFLGNPNAMGIFLVIGWFALLDFFPKSMAGDRKDKESCPSFAAYVLPCIEPVLLIGLALTLSLGSFGAMAVGILVLVWKKKKQSSWSEAIFYFGVLLSRASLGIGTGMLIYLAAARTSVPLLCLFLLLYAGGLMYCWKQYLYFLHRKPRVTFIIAVLGGFVAAAAVIVRPSAWATFAERLEMMQNGLRYFTGNPLLGVGPYQWRILNLQDGGKYFNTWHIHNLFIHIGVELGWAALAMLLIIAFRFFQKHTEPEKLAGFTAFCFHNLMDTSFFYMGILSLVMMTVGNPERRSRKLSGRAVKGCFAVFAAMFVYHLVFAIWAGR